MLGKVMKYELRSCGRLLLPFFGAALVLSGLARLAYLVAPLIWEPMANVLNGLATSVGVFALFGVILLTFVYVVVRFYQSMVAGEAYLSFTLPVGVGTHLAARLLAGILFCVASCLVAVLCALIFIPGATEVFSISSMPLTMNVNGTTSVMPASAITDAVRWSFAGLIAVTALISIVTNLLYAYVSFAAGGLVTKNRILGAVVAYLVISNVEGILSLVVALPFMFSMGRNTEELNAFMLNMVSRDPSSILGSLLGFAWSIVGLVAVVNLVFSVAHFLITRAIYTKRLNLE